MAACSFGLTSSPYLTLTLLLTLQHTIHPEFDVTCQHKAPKAPQNNQKKAGAFKRRRKMQGKQGRVAELIHCVHAAKQATEALAELRMPLGSCTS